MSRILFDYGLVPCLYEDYGHYLLKPGIKNQITTQEEKKNKEWLHRVGRDDVIQNIVLIDARLRIASMIDSLIREDDGMYRVYLSRHRLSQYCRDDGFMEMISRIVLSTVRKTRLNRTIRDDYVMMDQEKIHRRDESRRSDVKNIHRVHAILDGLDFLQIRSSNGGLYPNIKTVYTSFFSLDADMETEKQTIARSVRDVSQIWQCAVRRRAIMRRYGVYSWDDPRFLSIISSLVSDHVFGIIEKMMELMHSQHDFYIPSCIVRRFDWLSCDLSQFFFIDFETDFNKCIYMCGVYHQSYDVIWGKDISLESERDVMLEIDRRLRTVRKQLCFFYAERQFWRERCRVQQLHHIADLFDDAIDIHKLFVDGPIIIRGLFDFKLKHIARRLHELGHLSITQPSGCADGADSVRIAYRYFQTGSTTMKDTLEAYNRFDCEVLHAILQSIKRIIGLT